MPEDTPVGEEPRKVPHFLITVGLLLILASPAGPSLAATTLAFLRSAPHSSLGEAGNLRQETTPTASDEHAARRAVERDDFYDPANPARQFLQRHDEATRHLPHDAVGFPDWMRALREGVIKPRTGVSGKETMDVLDLDIVMRNTKEMPNVRFPHRSHTMWLACSNCHPAPFVPVAGANEIHMADIFRGRFCGMCHDRVAFVTFFSCDRCHSVPQGASSRH